MNDDREFPLLDRRTELLLDRATGDLDAAGQAELERLLAALPERPDEGFEPAAAALAIAWTSAPPEPLSPALAARLAADARGYFRFAAARSPRPWVPWLAAAACLVFALTAWWPAFGPRSPRPAVTAPADEQVVPLTTADGATVVGELRWSPRAQRGTLHLTGVPANNPRERQYQLWVFDRARDDRFPVDGGVFDVPAPVSGGAGGAAVDVAFVPRLPVTSAHLFAVTVEAPGGVVVSRREQIVALAAI